MRRFWGRTAVLVAALGAAMLATLRTPLGSTLWHYNASFVAATLAALVARPLLRTRRGATLSMAFSAVVAVVTGFAMLYTRDFPYKDWITWWHSFTSFALVLTFLVHWLHNRTRLWDLVRRPFGAPRAAGALVLAAWLGLVALGVWSVGAEARTRFTRENYLYLSSWAVLVGVVVAYGGWLVYRLPAMRARLDRTAHRNRVRGLVDGSLFLSHWGALLTGLALLWFADFLRGESGLKYVSKWWHTATSVAFLAVVTLHVGFNARLLAAHARRVQRNVDASASAGPDATNP